MAQADLRHKFRLCLVDAEADHEVRHDLGFLIRLAHNAHRLVNVEQDGLQAPQKMQLFLLVLQIAGGAAPHAGNAERRPLPQQLAHTHDARHTVHQHIEIAGEAVFQRRHAEQLLHELVRVCPPLEIDRDLQAVQPRLVADIRNLAQLALLDEIHHLFHDGFHRRGRRNLCDIHTVGRGIIGIARAHAEAAAARGIDVLHLLFVVDNPSAAREVGRLERGEHVKLRISDEADRRLADLGEVEGTDGAGHADGNAGVGIHQHGRERGGQQRGLLQSVVVIVDKIDGILVNVAEQLLANRVKPRFRITGGSPGHVARIKLAEVALRIHIGMQQRLISAGKAHHRVVDGGVAVRVELHRLADDVGALCTRGTEKPHFVHCEEQLAVGGLEAVDLRDGSREDDAHGVGHVVLLKRLHDRLLHHLAGALNHTARSGAGRPGRPVLLFRHSISSFLSSRRLHPRIDGHIPQCDPSGRSGCRRAAGQTPAPCVLHHPA